MSRSSCGFPIGMRLSGLSRLPMPKVHLVEMPALAVTFCHWNFKLCCSRCPKGQTRSLSSARAMPTGDHANYRVHVHNAAHAKSMQASTRHVATSQEAQRTPARAAARGLSHVSGMKLPTRARSVKRLCAQLRLHDGCGGKTGLTFAAMGPYDHPHPSHLQAAQMPCVSGCGFLHFLHRSTASMARIAHKSRLKRTQRRGRPRTSTARVTSACRCEYACIRMAPARASSSAACAC